MMKIQTEAKANIHGNYNAQVRSHRDAVTKALHYSHPMTWSLPKYQIYLPHLPEFKLIEYAFFEFRPS